MLQTLIVIDERAVSRVDVGEASHEPQPESSALLHNGSEVAGPLQLREQGASIYESMSVKADEPRSRAHPKVAVGTFMQR
jgi:hypothetical protein